MENVQEVEVVATEAAATPAQNEQQQPKRNFRDGNRPDRKGGRRNPRERDKKEDDGLITKLVAVNRVTKVVKGGRTMRFS